METIKVFLLSWLFFMIVILHRKAPKALKGLYYILTSKGSKNTKRL